MEEALRSALLTFFDAECGAHPVVLLLEDVHWADAPSVKLFGALLRELRDKPFMVLATARPEIHTTFPQLWSESVQEIRLGTLSKKASERFAKEVLGPDISPELVASLVDRAGGNPFFLEELLRNVAEGGDPRALPDTVLGVLQSRLDAFGAEHKRVLRAASILGPSFSADAIGALLGGSAHVSAHLAELVAKEIFDPAPGGELSFRHALLRDASYATLTDVDRKLGHELAGAWLERRGDLERPETVAYHFTTAGQFSRAYLHGRKAAARATRLSRFTEALSMLEEIHGWLMRLPEDADRRELLFELLLETERLYDIVGAREEQQRLLDELTSLLDERRDPIHLSAVAIRQAELHMELGRVDESFSSLRHAHDLARQSEDPDAELRALRSLAFACWQSGRDAEGVAYNEQIVSLCRSSGAGYQRDLVQLAMCLRRLGQIDRAMACLDESATLAEDFDPNYGTQALHVRANLYGELGDYENQVATYARALEIHEAHNMNVVHKLISLAGMGGALCKQGKIEEGLEFYRRHIRLARESSIRPQLARVLAIVGEILVGLERFQEALPFLEEAARVLDEPNLRLQTLERAARVARRTGNDVLTERFHREAIRVAMALGESSREAELLNELAIHFFTRAKYEEALGLYERALEIFIAKDDQAHCGLALNSIAATLEKLGRTDEALRVLELAVKVTRDAGERLLEGHALALLGKIMLARGDSKSAREHYEASLALRRAIGDRRGEGWMLHYLGVIAAANGDPNARELLESALSFGDTDDELSAACRRILEEQESACRDTSSKGPSRR